MSKKLTQERLKELLHYDPETGVFTWLVQRGNRAAGSRAGSRHAQGYRQIRVLGCVYLEHRVAHLYVHGCWPTDEVDHKNGERTDNRRENLRPASRSEQVQNTSRRKDNTSGYHGVGWFRPKGLWRARIRIDGSEKHLGYFSDPEEAHQAYLAAKARLHTFQPTPRAASQATI